MVRASVMGFRCASGRRNLLWNGQTAYMSEEDMAASMEHPLAPIANAISNSNQQMVNSIGALVDTINQNHSRPKTVVRGPDGKIQGVM